MARRKRAKPLDDVHDRVERAHRERATRLNLNGLGLTSLPTTIGELTDLESLELGQNSLASLPIWISQLANLKILDLSNNAFKTIPESILHLQRLEALYLYNNTGLQIPEGISRLSNLRSLGTDVDDDSVLPQALLDLLQLQYLGLAGDAKIPPWISQFRSLTSLSIINRRAELPNVLGDLVHLRSLALFANGLRSLPHWISRLAGLETLDVFSNELTCIPDWISALTQLVVLDVSTNQLVTLPKTIGQLARLEKLDASANQIATIPGIIGRLAQLKEITLAYNPLTPALESAYNQGTDAVKAYLRSLDNAEPLFEAKLVLVGEGNVGKTTLLKALSGKEAPRKDEPTTHGISIDIQSMHLAHPEKSQTNIQFNTWDFGGQEVYRATHQFFFSRRSIYLLVWEPRMGVQQCQVEDWLKLIRVRVGDDARVIIVSTHAKTGQRIARIDKPVLQREYGAMIVDFIEVDSLENFGIAELKGLISGVAKDLEHMGMPFNVQWRAARDAALVLGQQEPRVAYAAFAALCAKHGLDAIDTRTLAVLMHDLGYIVYYGDDERLKDDVILQPEWLTKAIGFVLEDRATQERDGILPDDHLTEVWLNHRFENEPTYPIDLYPFFLQLMEKYDVSYRLESGEASLVAQHVPQVRPAVPWLPEEEPLPERRRLAMVCVLDEAPPGLVPWLIVRTHPYAAMSEGHRLHWQKGMFLRRKPHGEALVELRDRELHLYAEAAWPEYFMNVLRQTVEKLITDNWPGMEGRYTFNVPCRGTVRGQPCPGRFDIEALHDILDKGDETIRCLPCRGRQNIVELLYGFEDEEPRTQLARIEAKIDQGIAGIESQIANSVMVLMKAMASEAKDGPRLFDLQPVDGNWRRLFQEKFTLRLWCEAENAQHPLLAEGLGSYELELTREWVREVAPYANLVVTLLKTVLPMVGPAVNVAYGANTFDGLGVKDHVDLMEKVAGTMSDGTYLSEFAPGRGGALTEPERHGLLALHSLLRQLDPNHAKLGLHRVPTYTGDYQWLCRTHYELGQSKIPDRILPVQ
ncbi:MAG TPA: COR domain-containing protein [Thermoanaerobaculia bacterium]|nr:COR domain-containing protein [Thermoanaerobaculia bacterium]